jgi:hypothetical protein
MLQHRLGAVLILNSVAAFLLLSDFKKRLLPWGPRACKTTGKQHTLLAEQKLRHTRDHACCTAAVHTVDTTNSPHCRTNDGLHTNKLQPLAPALQQAAAAHQRCWHASLRVACAGPAETATLAAQAMGASGQLLLSFITRENS